MPPVSTPSSASAGPGSAMVVSATWRIPSAAAAASRAARAASARPGSGVSVGGAGQSSDTGATVPNRRASAADAASARPRRMAASARAIASDASEPYSMPRIASRPARSATPTARRDAAGAASVSAVTAVSTASANAGASKPLPASWNEARFSTNPGALVAASLPDRRARRAVTQQQHPVQPLRQRHLQPGPQRPFGHRTDPGIGGAQPASPAPRPAPDRPARPPPCRPRRRAT